MEETTIKYGGQNLTLRKSENTVAVKAAPGMGPQLAATLSAMSEVPTLEALSGFNVIHVEGSRKEVDEKLDMLRASPAVSVGSHVYFTSDDQAPFVPTGQVYVVFKEDAPLASCQELLDRYRLSIAEALGERKLIAQVTPHSPNPVKVAEALQQSDLVDVAEPDLATPGNLTTFLLPQDQLLNHQWHLRNQGFHRGTSFGFKAGADARVIAAWQESSSLGSPAVVVAVIDDGFDLTHPDLNGAGKVIAPFDFKRNTINPEPEFSASYPFWNPTRGVWEGDWHGTACAGVAIGNANGLGIVGAAPGCRLMPVRWGNELSDAQVVRWFDYVKTRGAWVVSCSWGARARHYVLSHRMRDAITRCAREGRGGLGCVVCFAVGNENRDINAPHAGSVNGFAIHPEVIAVAATTSRDERSDYSNFGKEIAVCAPSSGAGGWGIATADVSGVFTRMGIQVEAGYGTGPWTEDFGGTSSACPLVAGICALLLSIRPTLRADQIKDIIQRTARKIGPSGAYRNGRSDRFGYGCVDAASAVRYVMNLR